MPNGNGIKVIHAARFLKSAGRLEKNIFQKLKEHDRMFRKNPFDPRLDTHKLSGRWQGYWAYSVDYKYRVIFVFRDAKTATYYDVGPNNIYGKK